MHLRDMQERALRIAGARAKWGEDDPRTQYEIAVARAAIRDSLRQATLWQRQWQSKTSPSPLRNRFHDSWTARERYVRANPTFDTRIAERYAREVATAAGYPQGWHRVTNCGGGIVGRPCDRCAE